MDQAPDPLHRPDFARYLWDRDLTFRDVAQPKGPLPCSHEQVRRICLPFSDPKRVTPKGDLLAAIVKFTRGLITGADFESPVEGERPGCGATLAAARAE